VSQPAPCLPDRSIIDDDVEAVKRSPCLSTSSSNVLQRQVITIVSPDERYKI
jgi:hypothetical protein